VEFWVAGGLIRLDGAVPLVPLDSWLRCIWRRSNSDPRDVLALSETLGEEAWGIDDLVMLSARFPNAEFGVWGLTPLGRLTSDGCGKVLRTLPCVSGE
jgi:hypothetical protein